MQQRQEPEPLSPVVKTEPGSREPAPSATPGSEEKPAPVRLRFGPGNGRAIAFRFEAILMRKLISDS
ncbi:MAG: hypothetical protein GY795_01055 [Desulfobacterales bacterium]|nr:hypothetical protein [Desulfobacterales bacterium]